MGLWSNGNNKTDRLQIINNKKSFIRRIMKQINLVLFQKYKYINSIYLNVIRKI